MPTDYYGNPEKMTDKALFSLLERVAAKARQPRLLLTKSIAATKRKPLRPSKPILVRTAPTDRELVILVGDAVARGLLSGTDGLEAQKRVDAGGKLPKGVRAVLLSYLQRGGR